MHGEAQAGGYNRRVLDGGHEAVGEYGVGPGFFCLGGVAVGDALEVESFVDVFEEGEADDAVVCGFVV